MTVIDPATGWFEIEEVPGTKRADVIANIAEQKWLTRHPWPQKIVLDRGKEFMAEFTRMVINDHGIKKKPVTARNPQANSTLERVHQTIGDMICTFRTQDMEGIDCDDPWSGVSAAAGFAVRATVSKTTRESPMQSVFQRDAVLNFCHFANWAHVEKRKCHEIERDND